MPAYSTSTNTKYPEIPQEVINYLRMVPVRDSNVKIWKTYKGFGNLTKNDTIVVPQHVKGDFADIVFSLAGNSALVGNTYINIYETVSDCWVDAYWDGWIANDRVDSPKAVKEAVDRIMCQRWWMS